MPTQSSINLARERQTVTCMIQIYCRGRHRTTRELCAECQALVEYAEERLAKCPFQDEKPVCAQCSVHCYKPEMRERIRQVMRYAGPRMLYTHPILAVHHLLHRLQ